MEQRNLLKVFRSRPGCEVVRRIDLTGVDLALVVGAAFLRF